MAELTLEQRRAMALAQARQRAAQAAAQPSGTQFLDQMAAAPRESAAPRQMVEDPQGAGAQLQEGPTPTRRQTPLSREQFGELAKQRALGMGELAATVGSGAVLAPLAGISGLETLAGGGEGASARAAEEVQRVMGGIYQPRTAAGQRILEGMEPLLALPEQAASRLATPVAEAGHPGLATAIHTAVEAAPAAVGIRSKPPRSQRLADIERLDRAAREQEVDLGGGFTAQREQIVAAGQRAEREMGRAESIPAVQTGIQRLAQAVDDRVNMLYSQARQGDASVPVTSADGFLDALSSIRQDFITTELPFVNRLLNEADSIRDLPGGAHVKLNALEDWHKKVNRHMKRRDLDAQQHAAMTAMVRAKEEWLDAAFDSAMIRGNPDDIQAWRRARAASADYKRRFSDDKVIRRMVEMEADPETVRKWIFGANSAGARTEAATTVRRLKQELGGDSPEFAALRADASLDVLEPLLRSEPNLRAFTDKYDRMVRSNPSLARELYGENLAGLTNLRDIVAAHRGRTFSHISELPGGSRFLAVAAFGHQLSQKALLVSTARSLIGQLADMTTQSTRRQMMGRILGYDPMKPMLGGEVLGIAAGQQALGTAAEGQGRQQFDPATERTLERIGIPGGP